jgi:HAD superfamily hydrolase (TIGR01662 family)
MPIVLLMGPPGSGKSTAAKEFVDAGYERLNRDEIGGTLQADGLVYKKLRESRAKGCTHFVLDNTYPTIASRAIPIDIGREIGEPVEAVVMETTREQAQFFAARRQIQRHGKLLSKDDYKLPVHKNSPNDFQPVVQFGYWNRLEPVTAAEGFSRVLTYPVKMNLGPAYTNKALILDFDGTLRDTISGAKYPADPKDIRILPRRVERLREFKAQGYHLLGASNQSGCSKEPGDPRYVSETDAKRCFDATCKMLGVEIDVLFAPDAAGVPSTYMRKPMPGMGVLFIEKYKLNPAACIMVGDRGDDRNFAARCGFEFKTAEEFFR